MQIIILAAFAIVLWLGVDYRPYFALSSGGWTLLIILIHPAVILVSALLLSQAIIRRLRNDPLHPEPAQRLQTSGSVALRTVLIAGFLFIVFATDWVPLVCEVQIMGWLYGLRGLTILVPFLLGVLMLWVGLFPADRALRSVALDSRAPAGPVHRAVWPFREYMIFHVRHHLLIIFLPMMPILITYEATRAHAEGLASRTGIFWAADGVLGLVAALVFCLLPSALCWIWSTAKLPPGPLEHRLRKVSAQIGLRYRKILVWRSQGLVVNAAVTGLFAPMRYVLLSDGLLETLDDDQVEAVFAHEAGHVKHHHIFFFLLFAGLTMMIVGGVTLALFYLEFRLSNDQQQLLALITLTLLWAVGFGWISRRFERQADVFGVRCITANMEEAAGNREPEERPARNPAALRPAAAERFADALLLIAELNGIPPEARSWRHSSIASRGRFLRRLAADPDAARRFDRLVRGIKIVLLAGMIIGGAITVKVYWPAEFFGFDI